MYSLNEYFIGCLSIYGGYKLASKILVYFLMFSDDFKRRVIINSKKQIRKWELELDE